MEGCFGDVVSWLGKVEVSGAGRVLLGGPEGDLWRSGRRDGAMVGAVGVPMGLVAMLLSGSCFYVVFWLCCRLWTRLGPPGDSRL